MRVSQFCAAFVFAAACSTANVAAAPTSKPANANQLKARLHQMIQNSISAHHGSVGVYVQVLKTGRVVYSENALKPMIPASNLKVVTTAVALDLLGPDFRYYTELRGGSPDGQGTVAGNLYLKGAGDPTWCLPYVSPTAPWKFFAKQLRERGVRRIEGDIVGDDTAFDREYLGRGWFDRYLLDSYAAPVSALSMNNNVVELVISSKGVRLDPPSTGFEYNKQLTEGGYEDVWVSRTPGSQTTFIKGSIPPGAVIRRGITVPNPGLFTVGSFASVLKSSGVSYSGRARLIQLQGEPAKCQASPLIARYQSPRLRDIIAQVNKESDNVFAQHVFKALGRHSRGYGTAANAEAAVRDFLRKRGVSEEGLVMVDGSGLSTQDRISPRQMVGVMDAMWRHPQGQVFVDSLPTGGEGTLTYRLPGLSLRAKTGTLDKHSGLSGYLVSSYGQTLGFSILVNDVQSTWAAVDLEDRILQQLAAWDQPL
jgi:serine-type D-Ala-D-Ala carboxypeptidase/endopeptidase (penicillin-binding protein 4)